jgi:uncharacterized protein (DUF488 family)
MSGLIVPQTPTPQNTVWTIGHGLQDLSRFIANLKSQRIVAVADVRTSPYSERAPQFNRESLESALASEFVQYVHLGAELGGRPSDPNYYDESGHVLYRRLSESQLFVAGMARVKAVAREHRVAILCSESDPGKCHRNLLIGRVLRMDGFEVVHILASGTSRKFDDRLVTEVGLSGIGVEDQWRSLVQVRQAQRQKSSSDE